jgi:hypothetical protein
MAPWKSGPSLGSVQKGRFIHPLRVVNQGAVNKAPTIATTSAATSLGLKPPLSSEVVIGTLVVKGSGAQVTSLQRRLRRKNKASAISWDREFQGSEPRLFFGGAAVVVSSKLLPLG